MNSNHAQDLALEHDFEQQQLDDQLRDDLEQLVRLAIREDLSRGLDWTTVAVVPLGLTATADIVSRAGGVASGLNLIPWIIEMIGADIQSSQNFQDGKAFKAGSKLATLSGDSRDMLTCERTILNFLGRLSGIASWTHQHVLLIEDLATQLYDTRKTTPGWRRLEKYAVRCGGGRNHRQGLYDAILIKDNHLACRAQVTGRQLSPSEAIDQARRFVEEQPDVSAKTIIEIEVDSLEQLADALKSTPDIVLLDNMSPKLLRQAVMLRDTQNGGVLLEASGGIDKSTLRAIAETGVDRISMGALTHSAINLDLGLDWRIEKL